MRPVLLLAVALALSVGPAAASTYTNPDRSVSPGVVIEQGGAPVATGNPLPASDAANASWQGVVPMTPGTAYAAGRGLAANCSAGGNVSFVFADGSTMVWTVAPGLQLQAFSVTQINTAGTTATCAYGSLH